MKFVLCLCLFLCIKHFSDNLRGRRPWNRSVIRFLNTRNVLPSEIHHQICQVHGENAMNYGMVRKWVRMFNEGRENLHNEARSGRPSLVNDDLVRKVNERVHDDRRFTFSDLSLHFPQISRTLLYDIVSRYRRPHSMRTVYKNLCFAKISASIMAANIWKNSLNNVECDNYKILYETLLDFFYSETVLTFWISLVHTYMYVIICL